MGLFEDSVLASQIPCNALKCQCHYLTFLNFWTMYKF